MMAALLMGQKEIIQREKRQQKVNEKYEETGADITIGTQVKMKQNRSVGIVKEIRGKKALLQVGAVPILVAMKDLIAVKEKAAEKTDPEKEGK